MAGIDRGTGGDALRLVDDPLVAGRPQPVLARSDHDRIAHRRRDSEFIDSAWRAPSSRVLVLSTDATARVTEDSSLLFVPPSRAQVAGERVLLGERDGTVYFAVLADRAEPQLAVELGQPGAGLEPPTEWRGLRALAVQLDDLQVGLLTAAVALQQWHQRHQHCPRCGGATATAQAGWTRICRVDGSEHFPRTDPAVIMLVTDDQDRCLLARGPDWPSGRLSVLAGFVEAGESAEAAVVREVGEEVGISIKNVRYVASQPHPFPASLMLGFTAELDGDPSLRPDPSEIAEAGWFTRDQVLGARDWGAESPTADGRLRALPSHMSIARQLIDAWVAAG